MNIYRGVSLEHSIRVIESIKKPSGCDYRHELISNLRGFTFDSAKIKRI